MTNSKLQNWFEILFLEFVSYLIIAVWNFWNLSFIKKSAQTDAKNPTAVKSMFQTYKQQRFVFMIGKTKYKSAAEWKENGNNIIENYMQKWKR